MGIIVKSGFRKKEPEPEAETLMPPLEPLYTPEMASKMLRATMKLVSINPTPGLLRRWAAGQIEAGVICPECGGDWDAWVDRETRRKERDLLPWES